jgi:hypothetical protein
MYSVKEEAPGKNWTPFLFVIFDKKGLIPTLQQMLVLIR